jgi:hypothetical protein
MKKQIEATKKSHESGGLLQSVLAAKANPSTFSNQIYIFEKKKSSAFYVYDTLTRTAKSHNAKYESPDSITSFGELPNNAIFV